LATASIDRLAAAKPATKSKTAIDHVHLEASRLLCVETHDRESFSLVESSVLPRLLLAIHIYRLTKPVKYSSHAKRVWTIEQYDSEARAKLDWQIVRLSV
jgi:hypothetical protein